MSFDPRTHFPQFYGNPMIDALGKNVRWTVSGKKSLDDDGKIPVDIRHVIEGCNTNCQHETPIRGAWATDEQCLVSLGELAEKLPMAANTAYWLNSGLDGVVVLDIEPSCPPELADRLLNLPDALYTETSMSGRGYHLLLPMPRNLTEHPIAASKRVLRHPEGHYELLMEHWVTFTRRPIPDQRLAQAAGAADPFADVQAVFAELAQWARPSAGVAGVDTDLEQPDVEGLDRLVDWIIRKVAPKIKSLESFHNDTSRWEFSTLALLYAAADDRQRAMTKLGVELEENTVVWMIYLAALKLLPARPKHEEMRNGRPYLLDRAAALVAERKIAAEG